MKDLDRHISRRNQDILNLADQRAKEDREREEDKQPADEALDEAEDPSFPSPAVQAAAAMIWPRKNFPSLTAWIDYVKKWWPKVPAMTAILDQHKPA